MWIEIYWTHHHHNNFCFYKGKKGCHLYILTHTQKIYCMHKKKILNYKNYAALNCWLFWISTDLKWQYMIKNCNSLAIAQIRFDTLLAWFGLIWTLYGARPIMDWAPSMGLAQIDWTLWAWPRLDWTFLYGPGPD